MKEIKLSGNNGYKKVALVDDGDFDELSKYKWSLDAQGYVYRFGGYIGNGKSYNVRIHRQLLCPPGHLVVDHINRDRLDNRRENLRVTTRANNAINTTQTKKTMSGYRGVAKQEDGLYMAIIRKAGKVYYFRNISTALNAAITRDAMATMIQGEYAVLNFPKNKKPAGVTES